MPVSPVNDEETEDFIDIESVAIATMPALESAGVQGAEFDAEPAP